QTHDIVYAPAVHASSRPRPLPPIPSLFPYTTLFRSGCPSIHYHGNGTVTGHVTGRSETVHCNINGNHQADHLFIETQHGLNNPEDRKSTRLNSSHVKISYAVFCLKKKNNKN